MIQDQADLAKIEKAREQARARSKRYYHKHLEQSRLRNRLSAAKARADPDRRAVINMRKRAGGAGLTPDQFEEMLAEQGGACAICGATRPSKKNGSLGWNIDHCHSTRKVRFILCSPCNRGLAAFRDKPDVLRKAAQLIEEINATLGAVD